MHLSGITQSFGTVSGVNLPPPGLRVDGLTHTAEDPERGQVIVRYGIAGKAHESTDYTLVE